MIKYSDKFVDSEYEYRYVVLPRAMTEQILELREQNLYLSEEESRGLGIIQSKGWVHYDYHLPEPHILLYKRPIGTNPRTGKVEMELKQKYFALKLKNSPMAALLSH